MSLKVLIAPLRYVQGPNALSQMGDQLQGIGIKNPLVMAGPRAMKACREAMSKSMEAKGTKFGFIGFNGESTFDEIKRIKDAW